MVNKIKKHLLGLTQSNILTLTLILQFRQNGGHGDSWTSLILVHGLTKHVYTFLALNGPQLNTGADPRFWKADSR